MNNIRKEGFEGDYMVFVNCMTYNQSLFIEKTLSGFIMQNTNFPYVCVILDDASTDGEQTVLFSFIEREFDMANAIKHEDDEAKTIISRSLKNNNCTFVIRFLKENHYSKRESKLHLLQPWKDKSKYVALCEGDDYWTDPLKLQKQVDLLESHQEVSLCFHPVRVLYPDMTFGRNPYPNDIPVETTSNYLAKSNYIATASAVYRNDNDYFNILATLGKMPFGDYSLWILCSQYGKIYCIQDIMAVYRVGSGVWSTKTRFEQYFDSAIGYSKIYTLFNSKEDKEEFDKLIWNFAAKAKIEYNYILESREYKLGSLMLKPIRIVVNAYRLLRQKFSFR